MKKIASILLLSLMAAATALSSTSAFASEQAPPVDWRNYDHLDPKHEVPDVPLKRAIQYYDMYKDKIRNLNFITVIDYTQHNSKKRMYVIDMNSGLVEPLLTAHGQGSDPKFTGNATQFSNTEGSKMSSVGYFYTAETYDGNNGYSLRLDGLSPTNSNARARAIVVHGADYVSDNIAEQNGKIGRSYGCPALDRKLSARIISQIKGGSVIYSWNGQ